MTGKRCPLPTVLLKIYFKIYFKLKIEVSLYTLRLYVCVFVYGEPTDQRRQPHPETRAAPVKEPALPARPGLFAQPRPCGALVPSTADRRCFRSASAAHRVSSSRRALLVFEHTQRTRALGVLKY